MIKRRLEDLYVLGKSVRIDDGQAKDPQTGEFIDDPVEVWVEKLLPFQSEKALRAANAARSTVLAMKRDRTSEDFAAIIGELREKSPEQILEEVANEEIFKRSEVLEAELAAEDEWSKDNYLQGLRDAWGDVGDEDSKARKYLDDPQDPEAKTIFNEFQRFTDELNVRIEAEKRIIFSTYENKTAEEIEDIWLSKRIESEADQAWVREFRKQEVFYATRTAEDHKKYYFGSRNDIDFLPAQVWLILMSEYNSLTVDVREGKDSRPTPTSLPPSESQDGPVMEVSSGRSAAIL